MNDVEGLGRGIRVGGDETWAVLRDVGGDGE